MNGSKWVIRTIILLVIAVTAIAVASASEFHAGNNQADSYSSANTNLPPGVTQDAVNKVASKMYCDVCEGIPLDECESVTCSDWREEIGRLLGEGQTEDEILDYFIVRYGDDVSGMPRDPTDRALSFAIPFGVFLIIGGIGLYQVLKLRRRGAPVARRSEAAGKRGARPVPADSALVERLERELEGFES